MKTRIGLWTKSSCCSSSLGSFSTFKKKNYLLLTLVEIQKKIHLLCACNYHTEITTYTIPQLEYLTIMAKVTRGRARSSEFHYEGWSLHPLSLWAWYLPACTWQGGSSRRPAAAHHRSARAPGPGGTAPASARGVPRTCSHWGEKQQRYFSA